MVWNILQKQIHQKANSLNKQCVALLHTQLFFHYNIFTYKNSGQILLAQNFLRLYTTTIQRACKFSANFANFSAIYP